MSEWSALGYAITELGRDILPESVTGKGGEVPAKTSPLQELTTYHTSRGGNSNGLHVTQGSAPKSDRHSASSELDGTQKRNGCVAQMDMPRTDAANADESSSSAVILDRHGDDRFADNILRALEGLPQYGDDEEERDAAEEGALIEASGYNDPANDPRFA